MAGSMRARPDKGRDAWELRIFLGRDEQGRVRHRSRLFRGTRKAAERELARLVVAQEEQPQAVPSDTSRRWGPTTTFNDAIEAWRENGWDDLSPMTARRYDGVWRTHIKDSFGRRRIASTGPYDVEQFLRQLKAAGAGRETVRYVRAILHRSCRLARKWSGNTLPNPVTDTEMPKWTDADKGSPVHVRAPTLEEVVALLKAAESLDLRYRAALQVLAATGMRRGEACALRWDDVDLVHQRIRVDESAISAPGGTLVKGPKTRASIRQVTIDSGTLAVLEDLRAEQKAIARLAEVDILEHGFVFSFEPDGAVAPHPDSISKAFVKARRLAGLDPALHLHSLRHFQATVLDSVISERQKQARLGWSTVHMARHYTDAVSEEDRRAADYLGSLLTGAPHTKQESAP